MLELIKALWPFIKELFFSEVSYDDEIIQSKRRFIIIIIITLSLGFNILSLRAIYLLKLKDDALLAVSRPSVIAPATTKDLDSMIQDNLAKDLKDIDKNHKNICPKFIFPDLPKVPEFPINILEKIPPSNKDEIITLEKNHIIVIHKYLEDISKIVDKSYSDYKDNYNNIYNYIDTNK